jgi:phosphatidylserine decarboxylase
MIVKQISGAIARRIVCEAEIGDRLGTGEKFGMIKYGSRTELYLPVDDSLECLVKIGDKVKAGTTVLYRYRERNSNE